MSRHHPPALRSDGSAISAMANAPSATPTSGRLPWYASVTNAPSATTRTNAWFAAERESVMHSTASSAPDWRRTGMAVRRL
ncbi:hypothetical protein BP5796_09898 [Coleophoma crateriformis]|uniref:Uncharacterized protein n=1 Tax=Coleophoma crateriformis TaxID=565419 RepID=A0A3D8QTP2_9HELO|nr:hypothetical protein BP5796_09898 [Coleophoma crateriformis]